VCQLESIGACALPATARKQLKQLPRTLDETYDRILKSIPEVNESAARAALMFLAKSMRPLTLEELAEAVIINVEDQRFSIEERLGLPLTDILEICSSLVTVSTVSEHDAAWMREKNTIERGCGGREVSIIRFAHFSVKEYLASDRLKETPLSAYYFSESIAHQYIAEASLVYLFGFSNGERVVGADFQEYRFLAYAARFWHEHWRKIPPDEEQNCLTQLLQQMYDPDRPSAYINWLNIFNPDFREYHLTLTRRSGRRVEHFPSPVYFTAYFGHYGMSEWLISSGCDTNSSNGARMLGGPLQVTAYAGHTDIVRLLLNNSATVNTKCGHFGDALQAAAFGGHEEIVKLLFQHGAIANTECGRYGSALIAAAQEGHFKVAKLLIEYGAEPNALSERHGKALAAAAASGGMEIVKLLLTSGNDINDTNGMKGSALYSASAGRDLNVVRILLKAGADIDLLSGEMNTALQAACSNRHIDVVRFLLAKGADVNIRGGKYGDALQACTHNGDPGIFHLLLKHGANIEHEGGTYYSALWCAVYTCKTIAAEILLDRGATCSDEIFLMAIQYQLPTIVSRLLKRGVDVNAQGKEGSALQLAITHNGLDIASILLQSEDIDVNARDGVNGGSPLHSALVQGNEQIVRNLLERGADVNSVGGDCHKPLTAAVVSGKESLFLLLLDEGADLNGHREGRYRSPLIEAAGRGYEGIVRLLLDRGVDVNEYGYDQSNGRKGIFIRSNAGRVN
jgi:ankyrin repeat protein